MWLRGDRICFSLWFQELARVHETLTPRDTGRTWDAGKSQKLTDHIFTYTQEAEGEGSRGRTGNGVRLYTLKAHPQWCASSSNTVPPKVSTTPQRVAPTQDEVFKYMNLWRTFLIQSTSRKQKVSGKHSALWERIPRNWHFETREMSPDCQQGVNWERSLGSRCKGRSLEYTALSSWEVSQEDNRDDMDRILEAEADCRLRLCSSALYICSESKCSQEEKVM